MTTLKSQQGVRDAGGSQLLRQVLATSRDPWILVLLAIFDDNPFQLQEVSFVALDRDSILSKTLLMTSWEANI